MAEADFADFLTCPVCLDTLREPVTLGCHHSFCNSCLQGHWDQNNTKNCPVCRRKSSKDVLIVNFALEELSISFRQKQKTTATTQKHPEVCSQHPEVPPLFCKDEGRALCPVCEFSQHQHHTVVRVEEVQEQLKEQMKSELETLSKQREKLSVEEKLYEDITQHTEKQAEQCENHIRAVFFRLHLFLKEEETRALEDLKKEQQRQTHTMSPELGRIREELASVETTIQELKELLQKDTETLIKHFNKTQSKAKAHSSQPKPQLSKGLMIDQAKVLGNLGFRVWRRMRREVSYCPVILDPNTAAYSLHLSEDLSRVRNGETENQKVLDNLERFTKHSSVLGAEGLSCGTHQWDVEVGDHPDWIIGVAKESVDRKGKICATPEYGVWCLWHRDQRYTNGCSKSVQVKTPPVKIRVKLDYDRGTVSFYDADHMTHFYTHKDRFSDKLFPYFSVGRAGEANTKEIKICPTEGPL